MLSLFQDVQNYNFYSLWKGFLWISVYEVHWCLHMCLAHAKIKNHSWI